MLDEELLPEDPALAEASASHGTNTHLQVGPLCVNNFCKELASNDFNAVTAASSIILGDITVFNGNFVKGSTFRAWSRVEG